MTFGLNDLVNALQGLNPMNFLASFSKKEDYSPESPLVVPPDSFLSSYIWP